MGWFTDKYGENAHPIMPIELFSKLFDIFGQEAAEQTCSDVQEGKISVETLEKYIFDDESKEDYLVRLKNDYKDFE